MTVPHEANGETGQASVELALCFPLFILLFLLFVQVGLLMQRQILVIHATREAARVAAVSSDQKSVESAAKERTALSADRVLVRYVADKDTIRVGVQYTDPTDIPLIGSLLPDVKLQSAVTTRIEK